jgi:hypothetical protein
MKREGGFFGGGEGMNCQNEDKCMEYVRLNGSHNKGSDWYVCG